MVVVVVVVEVAMGACARARAGRRRVRRVGRERWRIVAVRDARCWSEGWSVAVGLVVARD